MPKKKKKSKTKPTYRYINPYDNYSMSQWIDHLVYNTSTHFFFNDLVQLLEKKVI